MIQIRDEHQGDADAIRAINDAAFGQPVEGAIVDALRVSCEHLISLVAVDGGRIVGHILFSPVELRANEQNGSGGAWPYPIAGMGLAPMAVIPGRQNEGIGSKLVREGLARVREQGAPYVVVLGHAAFYPKFGFERASTFQVRCPWDVPDDAFMLIAFDRGSLPQNGGTVYYRDEFNTAI